MTPYFVMERKTALMNLMRFTLPVVRLSIIPIACVMNEIS